MAEQSIFISLLDRMKRGNTSRPLANEKTVITGNQVTPNSNPIQQKQQQFLDVQSNKIAQDIYSRSVYYDTDRLGAYADFRAMDMSPEVSAALDIITDECLEASTLIPLLDGTNKTIEELYNNNFKNFYVYSINPENGQVEPSICEKVIYKGEQDVYEIKFDDDSTVLATSEHLWLSKNSNEYKTTKNLKEGDSIEPFYRKISSKEDRIFGYEMILERNGKFEFTHRIVKRNFWPEQKGVCHHKDFNKLNNIPENLQVMNWFDHQRLHSALNSERWENEDFANKMKKVFSETNSLEGPYWSNSDWRERQINKFKESKIKYYSTLTEEEKKEKHGSPGDKNPMFEKGYKLVGEKNGRYLHDLKHEFDINEIIDAFKNSNSLEHGCKLLNTNKVILRKSEAYKKLNIERWEDIDFIIKNISLDSLKKACLNTSGVINLKRSLDKICKENNWKTRKVRTFLNKNGFEKWGDFVDSINHSIKSIKYIGKRKTYDLANVGEHHNFAILSSNGENGVFSHNCVTRNERGDILSIYSENQRIKTVLKDLFKNRLNIEYNLTFWIREMVKFGDTFIKLELDQKEGIYDCRMLPVSEMHREEAFDGNVNTSRFKWDINNMYFEEFQMAHFRLISDGTKIPYGRSVLDSARKLWKQLQLAEDAMLVYRIVRAPERRVHYIEVGNLEPGDVQQYIEKIKRELKKAPIVDQKTGQVNLKYNPMPVWKETPIPLLDGRTITIEELAKEYNEGKENFVYSVQDDTHKVVPGKVVWCGMNYTAKQLTKVWLDDNTWVLTAPEHPFVMRDGRHVRADELKEGDSLMPFYVGEDKKIYNPENGKYEYVNNLIYLEEKESSNINTEQYEYENHKVLRIENVEVKGEDVYCMTVKGLQNEDDRHNFAMFSFDLNGNNSGSGIFVRNTLEEDYFLPIRGDKSSRIESLPGASNLSEISDVEYLQNKLFSALKVPKPYLNYAESMPGGSTLSQADLRFSRTINRIQENVIIELRRIANIHLFLLGFEDDMDNFDLKLTNPSTQQELLKLETMKARLEVFKEIFTNEATSPVSYTWAMEYIMGFSKSEIKQILRQKKVEKKMFSEIDSAPEEYNATGLFKEIDDKFQKTTGNLGQADAPTAGGEEMSANAGGETTDMDAGGTSFGGESAFGGGGELPTSEPEATTEEPSAEPLAENLLFENEKNNDLIESLFENKNKKLNTKTQRLVDSITERLNKINEETNSDEDNDSLNSGNFDSNVL